MFIKIFIIYLISIVFICLGLPPSIRPEAGPAAVGLLGEEIVLLLSKISYVRIENESNR